MQEYRSEASLEALSTLVPPRCNVLRAGNVENILAEELVPGDILRLNAGDRVAADGRILHCNALTIDESNLSDEKSLIMFDASSKLYNLSLSNLDKESFLFFVNLASKNYSSNWHGRLSS